MQGKVTYFDYKNDKEDKETSEIREIVNRCDDVIFIISPDSKNIEKRQKEIEYFQQLNKRIFIILYCFV